MASQPLKTKPARPASPRIGRAVQSQVAELAQKAGAMDPGLVALWPEIVGPELAKLCRPVKVNRRGRAASLVVAASNGAAAMRIQYAQSEIVQRAASFLKLPHLKSLQITQRGQPGQPASAGRQWASQPIASTAIIGARGTPSAIAMARPCGSVSEALARLRQTIWEAEGDDAP